MAATLSDLNSVIQDVVNLVDRIVPITKNGSGVDLSPQVANLTAAADKLRAAIAPPTP